MTGGRRYPDEPADPFPRPPYSFRDAEDRPITIERVDWDRDREAVVAFYLDYDPADRAQGIPPIEEPRIRGWLSAIEPGYDAVAWHRDRVVGHATLVPDDDGAYELAIFVLDTHQNAGIGTHLLEALLGVAQAADVDRVWLSVERWNHPAIAVYEAVGFETTNAGNFELEMGITL